jgi:hypothetical protein
MIIDTEDPHIHAALEVAGTLNAAVGVLIALALGLLSYILYRSLILIPLLIIGQFTYMFILIYIWGKRKSG